MRTLFFVALSLLGLVGSSLVAYAATEDFTIGYLELKNDPRYSEQRTYARYLMQALGRPFVGAEVALDEVKFHGAAAGVQFMLERIRARDVSVLSRSIEDLSQKGVRFFIVDLPEDALTELATTIKDNELLLFNISSTADHLRQKQCEAHLLHVIPSDAMLMDALGQYLVSRRWKRVLVLEGPQRSDQRMSKAFERSASRYGAKIVDTRRFVLGTDPRRRDQNNVALLTAGVDYDVVFVADTNGEFAREVPYQTVKPQLIVGSEGLAALAWHWSWERHGAPQLEKRFEEQAERAMTSVDWAAWMAVKIIAGAVQRTRSADFETIKSHLLSPELIIDGFKGNRLNFRPWNHQIRQPILIATHNWVVARAPLDGFLHHKNDLDTLGFDERESQCAF